MKDFDKIFAAAVKSILMEQEGTSKGKPTKVEPPKPKPAPAPAPVPSKEKDKKIEKKPGEKSALEMIKWSPGPGRWSEVITSLKKEVATYQEAVQSSAAGKGTGGMLMAKLGIFKKAEGKNDIESVMQILQQAITKNETMKEAYEKPAFRGVEGDDLRVPIAAGEEELSDRNATAYIHLTLIGAYNSKMLVIRNPIQLVTSGREIRIVKAR